MKSTINTLITVNRSLRISQANIIVLTVASLTKKPALIAEVNEIPIILKHVPNPDWIPLAKNNFQNNLG
jgi:hypothetical protein